MIPDEQTRRQVELLQRVASGRAETTIVEVAEVFGAGADATTLEKLVFAQEKLHLYGLQLNPGFGQGEVDTVRRLCFASRPRRSKEQVLDDLGQPEGQELEFKSSLLCDHQMLKHRPDATPEQLRSQDVLHSALKTIAGLLTSAGGVLYVGVDDARTPIGLDIDFRCASEKNPTQDGWELSLRDFVKSRFKDGDSINRYMVLDFVDVNGVQIACLQISPRNQLSFLKNAATKEWTLFRRDGNRTIEVKIDQVEEYLAYRRSQSTSA